jgi:hypothetical protein
MRGRAHAMRASRLRSFVLALVPAITVAAAFWVPARHASRGWFPSPLDDVYIHFDFARALATGHPFEWIPGQGYSSGETAPLYAVILAFGHLVGFHGRWLGVWAAIVAVLCVASLVRSTARLVGPLPWYSTALLAVVPLSFGVVDWALFSGMEVAPFAACLGAALLALDRARAPLGDRSITRQRAQWLLGAWGVPLVLLRPEAVVLVFVFAVVAARGAGARSGFAALFRVGVPGAVATLLVALANRLGQGDPRSAGVQLKLLSSNPYLSEVDRARVFVENLVTFYVKVLRGELAFVPAAALVVPLLGLVALASPRKRPLAAACLLGAFGWVLLVSWNGNAPHHNFRYYAPAILLLAIAAALGLSILRGRRTRFAGAIAGAAVIASAATTLPRQVEHFALATGNIRDQHIELAERIASLPADARILVGDAGAIPFVSRRAAVDALGLGGYRGLPFAHAAVHGEPATIELLERLAPADRPTHLALYPNWFRHTTTRFGIEIDRVTLGRNVICGGPTKALYRADWSSLDDGARSGEVFDELDVADVISEEQHAYVSPAPNGGWTTLDVLGGRFDGGRIIPAGGAESFVVRGAPPGRARVVLRTDARPGKALVRSPREETEVVFDAPRAGSWTRGVAVLAALAPGERIEIVAVGVELRDYHVWIEAE